MREGPTMRGVISTVLRAMLVIVAITLAAIAGLLSWMFGLKAKLSATEVATYLRDFIEGSGNDWDWDDFTSVPIANPQLDDIRRRAAAVDLPSTEEGLTTLQGLLAEAERLANYAEVDGVIDAWVKKTGSALYVEWAGKPARYFHLSGDPPFECFQIVVFPPTEGGITVQAASIDTNDDAEMMKVWDGPVATLDDMIGVAVATVEQWKRRERNTPDPPSPW